MRRGDIYLVDMEPVRGSGAGRTRPAVVVSNNAANQSVERHGRGVVAVAPLTSNTSRVLPFQVFLAADESQLSKAPRSSASRSVRSPRSAS